MGEAAPQALGWEWPGHPVPPAPPKTNPQQGEGHTGCRDGHTTWPRVDVPLVAVPRPPLPAGFQPPDFRDDVETLK